MDSVERAHGDRRLGSHLPGCCVRILLGVWCFSAETFQRVACWGLLAIAVDGHSEQRLSVRCGGSRSLGGWGHEIRIGANVGRVDRMVPC
jgi:hypothetical protein